MEVHDTYIKKKNGHFEIFVQHVNIEKARLHGKLVTDYFEGEISREKKNSRRVCIYGFVVYSFESNFFHWNYEDFFKHAPFSFDRLWQFRGQIGKFENLKMAVPLVAILAPETSYYLVVIYIELPFHGLCKQFTIITVVFIGLLVQKAKFLLHHGNQHQNPSNHLEDIGTMQSSNLSSKHE